MKRAKTLDDLSRALDDVNDGLSPVRMVVDQLGRGTPLNKHQIPMNQVVDVMHLQQTTQVTFILINH